jgi:hypothetical protein
MRKIFLYFLTLLVVFGFSVDSAKATIFLSGDGNIINPIEPSIIVSVDPGNQQFFENILQGGTSVLILQGASGGSAAEWCSHLITFYTDLGKIASLISGPVTGAQLAGVNLFIAPVPADPFDASEISALNNFLTGGGSIFFLGENEMNYARENGYINDALIALGSSLSIIGGSIDAGFHTVTDSQIVVDPFTTGVTSFSYGYTSQVVGGTYLLFESGGQPFVEFSGAALVLEPSTMILLGYGLIGLSGYGKKKFFKK